MPQTIRVAAIPGLFPLAHPLPLARNRVTTIRVKNLPGHIA